MAKTLQKKITFIIILLLATCYTYGQGYLHVNGKTIVDGSGKEVILRGIGTGNWMIQEGYMMQTADVAGTMHEFRSKLINLIGTEKTDSFYNVWLASHFNKVDVDSMKSWGFNSVRVALHYKWLTPPIEDEPVSGEITWFEKGFVLIDSLLDWCAQNEMYLILDLHGAPGGQGKDANISDYDPSKPSLWESQANKDKTIALWRKLAERYSSEPWMGGYDLINETNWPFPEGNNSKLRELLVNITSSIREVDNNHIIFIEGNSFANDFSGLTPPWDANMVYSFHKYWNDNTQESINFVTQLRNNTNRPIWLGESGENSNVWFTSAINLFESNKIGWSWWPVKKPGINNPLRVIVNEDYTNVVNYWRGKAQKPTVDEAFKAVLTFALNHKLENCIFQKDVVDAMIRQPNTKETIPYILGKIGKPVFFTNFNLGRNKYAYEDSDTSNIYLSTGIRVNWNQGGEYRNDGVDIEKCTDADSTNGYNVGWTLTGEWMEYTLFVDSTAAYNLTIRSASNVSGGSKGHFEIDGIAITESLVLQSTAGWQNWQSQVFEKVILSKGTHKIKFIIDKEGSNLNYFMFSKPVSINDVVFKLLYAETSETGKTIKLILNKPVTTEEAEILVSDFLVTCNNTAWSISSIALSETLGEVFISFKEPLYYGGIIKLAYNGNSIKNGEQFLEEIEGLDVKNNLPLRTTLPARIQAENYFYNNGFKIEECKDVDGGFNMGWVNPGDYLDYLVYVPVAKKYDFKLRVASEKSGQLLVQINNNENFTSIDTIKISSTGGWQKWKTETSQVFLSEGRYTLRLFARNGEYNTNWFQISNASNTSLTNTEKGSIKIYPNPAKEHIYVSFDNSLISSNTISIYNALGIKLKEVHFFGKSPIEIQTSQLAAGIYYIYLIDNDFKVNCTPFVIN